MILYKIIDKPITLDFNKNLRIYKLLTLDLKIQRFIINLISANNIYKYIHITRLIYGTAYKPYKINYFSTCAVVCCLNESSVVYIIKI